MALRLNSRARAHTAGVLLAALTITMVPASSVAVADQVSDAKAAAAAAAAAAAGAQADVVREQARIASVRRQMAALNVQAEIAAEAYNGAVEKLAWANRLARAARDRLATATAVLLRLRTRAGAVAVEAYQNGGLSQLELLTAADGPATLLDRAVTLDAVAHAQQNSLSELSVAKHEQAFAKVAADTAATRQRQLTADKRRQRDVVLRAAAREQQLLGQLQDAQAALVAQAQAAVASATSARRAVDVAIAAKALAAAKARAAALATERAAQAQAAAAFRSASSARQVGSTRPVPVAVPAATFTPPRLGSGGAAVAVAWAYREIGKPYVWAAAGPDAFDCSGLTQYVWAKAGISLGHYTGTQINQGRPVSKTELISGDLVFFGSPIHHVGIYVGSGMMIDAPHTGALVREEPVWWPQYAGAVRPSG